MKMKNKRAAQIAAKRKHKASLKAKRRRAPSLERNRPVKIEKPTILIVCEGENTEPSYFRQFKLSSATVKPIGEGYNTTSLVRRANQLSEEKKYDQVWCVFDKDDFDPVDFNNAITTAETSGFNVAYSNQAFEYWIILHFEDHQGGGLHRDAYYDKITDYLKPFAIKYNKKACKTISEDVFDLLTGIDDKTGKDRTQLVIERAKRNYDLFDHSGPATEESSTTVFRIVEELLKYV
ncbi:MAG: RloB family protein [Cytophagales bacterium]|nr:RloB family protein [Cytophagales bacterium]